MPINLFSHTESAENKEKEIDLVFCPFDFSCTNANYGLAFDV